MPDSLQIVAVALVVAWALEVVWLLDVLRRWRVPVVPALVRRFLRWWYAPSRIETFAVTRVLPAMVLLMFVYAALSRWLAGVIDA